MTSALVNYDFYQRALESLKAGLVRAPANELERDGVIQRFEYSFEMAWRAVQRYLKAQGRAEVSGSPRVLLRAALEEGLIAEIEVWFAFLDARNASTHTYNPLTAAEVFAQAERFPPYAEALLQQLQARSSSE